VTSPRTPSGSSARRTFADACLLARRTRVLLEVGDVPVEDVGVRRLSVRDVPVRLRDAAGPEVPRGQLDGREAPEDRPEPRARAKRLRETLLVRSEGCHRIDPFVADGRTLRPAAPSGYRKGGRRPRPSKEPSLTQLRFDLARLPDEASLFRTEVRAFLAETLADFPADRRSYTWMGSDPAFSRKMAERGWIGMTWPKRYGGGERSAFERYVVLEEMLAAGAPVGAHWVADRQSGPLLLKYGSEAQRREILPGVCRGETFFCIGMSEPDSGSDLASIRTRAERVDDGWRINGTKLWTSGAPHCAYMIALVRTTVVEGQKHAGLSQLLVPLDRDGIEIRAIQDLAGNRHFCEVTFTDAIVPEDAVIGEEGGGWAQVMAELAYERSGPERYLSCHPLLTELVRHLGDEAGTGARERTALGRQVAHLATLRQMSVAVAGLLDRGASPALEAAVVKDLGGVYEQDLPGIVQSLVREAPRTDDGASDLQRVLAHLMQNAPSFSLRGGTREVLRGIIARGLGLR